MAKDEHYHLDVGSCMAVCGALIDPIENRKKGEAENPADPCPICVGISGFSPKKHPPGHPRAGQYVRHDETD